jgi:hypothetical protein
MDFDNFDPQSAARGGHLFFLGLKENGLGDDVDPTTIFDQFNTTFSDNSRRQAIINGGVSAFDGFDDFIRDPSGFRPADHFADFKAPPGSACVDDDDCLPCDACTNLVCTSLSIKMGLDCTDNTSCDDITNCVGGFHTNSIKKCMCSTGIPEGAFVQQTRGEGPRAFGEAGGFARPDDGGSGAPCGSGLPACIGGNTCSGNEHGVCLSAAFKKGPFAPCTADSECKSADCTATNLCASFTPAQLQEFNSEHAAAGGGSTMAAGNKAIGQVCNAPSECATFFCIAGVCTAAPDNFSDATHEDAKKANGQACTIPFECASGVCAVTCQPRPVGGGAGAPAAPPSNLPVGAFCNGDMECASMHCNLAMRICGA